MGVTIYMEQTLALIAMNTKDNPQVIGKLIESGTIKEYNGIRYLVIDDNLKNKK
jgi:hypothetical protein